MFPSKKGSIEVVCLRAKRLEIRVTSFPRLKNRGTIEDGLDSLKNDGMVIRGRVEHGVIVLEDGATLPDGVAVEVIVRTERATSAELAEEQKRKRAAVMAELAALPEENPTDRLDGSDHDQILY